MRKLFLGLLICLILIVTSCSPQQNYTILNEDKLGQVKYSLDIEIPNEIEESEIERFSQV